MQDKDQVKQVINIDKLSQICDDIAKVAGFIICSYDNFSQGYKERVNDPIAVEMFEQFLFNALNTSRVPPE